MVQHGGQGEHRSAQKSGERAQQNAQDDDGFECDVGREKVGHDQANPDAQRQGDAEEGQQPDGLRGGAPLGKQAGAERSSARAVTAETAAATPSLISSEMRTSFGSITLLLYAGWTRGW